MESISQSLNQRTIAIGVKTNTTIAIDYSKKVSNSQADIIIEQVSDLIDDPKFKPFFFRTLTIVGPDAFYESADWARKTTARCQGCMFVKRLKEHRDRAEKACIASNSDLQS